MNNIKNVKSKSIISAASLLSIFALLSRIIGLLRDRLLASEFGASEQLDIYMAAFRIPDFLFNIIVLGALSAAFIPIFTKYITKNKLDRAWRFTNTIINLTIIVLIVISIPIIVFAKQFMILIAPGLPPEARELAAELTRIMLLSPLIFSISNIAGSVLQSFKKFFLYSLAPLFYNLGIIFGIIVLVPKYGVHGLAYGVILGAILHLLVQLPAVFILGFRYKIKFDLQQKSISLLTRLMGPRTLSLLIVQINLLIITAIASFLQEGSITIFNFANNLQSVPIGVIGISFAVAAFPFLSEASSKNNYQKFLSYFSKAFRQIIFYIVPISVLMFVLRAQIVRLVLGSGEFDWEDTVLTLETLAFFALSLFAQGLIPLLVRSFHTLEDTKTPLQIGLVSMAINAALAYPLASIFGVAGLALAFSIASIVQMISLYVLLKGRLGNLNDNIIIKGFLHIIVSSILAGLIVYLALYLFAPILDTRTFVGLLLQTIGAVILGTLLYLGYHYLLKTKEFKEIFNGGK
ncbi:MAG: murein biosynthesis integral membrane protein MurJ [bacterium]